MSMGEKLVEKAWDSMEADMRDRKSCRRDFFYAVLLAAVTCCGLAAAIAWATNKTGISDAFEGGRMAKVALPEITEDIASIRMDVQRIAGSVDVLIGHKVLAASQTQDESRVCNQ